MLVWKPQDGWEPLCELLELPVPDQPFPRVNDTEMFGVRIVDGAVAAVTAWRAQEAPTAE